MVLGDFVKLCDPGAVIYSIIETNEGHIAMLLHRRTTVPRVPRKFTASLTTSIDQMAQAIEDVDGCVYLWLWGLYEGLCEGQRKCPDGGNHRIIGKVE